MSLHHSNIKASFHVTSNILFPYFNAIHLALNQSYVALKSGKGPFLDINVWIFGLPFNDMFPSYLGAVCQINQGQFLTPFKEYINTGLRDLTTPPQVNLFHKRAVTESYHILACNFSTSSQEYFLEVFAMFCNFL